MIPAGAQLTIRRIPLSQLIVTETADCYPEKFTTYLQLLQDNPDQDVDPLIVHPSTTYPGIYAIANGKHRYASSIIAGRSDALCIVVEESV
jgi:hypothetical protein